MIRFERIKKTLNGKLILNELSLTINAGEITYIVGPSGTGKSVLMKHALGFFVPDSGKVFVDGIDVTSCSESVLKRIRQKCCMVFQHPALLDHLDVEMNVALPVKMIKGLSWEKAIKTIEPTLASTGLIGFRKRYPYQISEGIKKIVSVARALSIGPECIILDEPTTGLDYISSRNVDDSIKKIYNDLKITLVVISHDIRSIREVATRVVMIYKGKVIFEGTKEEFFNSERAEVRMFIQGNPAGPT